MSDDHHPMRERTEARVGETLRGKWKLDRVLGIGGMASVYAATHRNGKRGAIKLLHPELALSSEARARFLREGYLANAVAHRGAVSVLDDDMTEDGSVFLVMELLEGATVEAAAEACPGRVLSVAQVLAIADELLDVLAAAHDKGVVHRDLKPENLFLTHDGGLRVLDFGIARLRQTSEPVTATRTGHSMGTPAYMPPEQALGDWNAVDARTDLWAVGATMYTLLTGRFVHEAENVQKMMLAAMTRPAPPLLSIDAALPSDLAAVVDRALAQRREDRFVDARTMQAAVRGVIAGQQAPRADSRDSIQRDVSRSRAVFSDLVPVSGQGKTIVSAASTPSLARSQPQRPLAAPQLMTAAPVSSDKRPTAAEAISQGTNKPWKLALGVGLVAFGATVALVLRFATPSAAPAPAGAGAGEEEGEATDARSTASVAADVAGGASSSAAPIAGGHGKLVGESIHASASTSAAPSTSPSASAVARAPAPVNRPRTAPPKSVSPPPAAPVVTTFRGRF